MENNQIELADLEKRHLPLTVKPYETGEGNDGFGIFTAENDKVFMESGSYGYDTFFNKKIIAERNCSFLNSVLKDIK